MRAFMTAAGFLAAVTFAGPAAAEGSYYVRNDTGEPQSCSVRYPGTEAAERIVLGRGGEWRGTSRNERPRVMVCLVGARAMYFRLESGRRYTLTKAGTGTLALSAAN